MNTPQDPNTPEVRSQVDERRRRFTKGGLAAPIVMGTLLSRPVLGAAPHNCTISGQMSGNVSTHVQGVCSTLGASPTTWKTKTSSLVNKDALFTAVGFTDTYWKRTSNNRIMKPSSPLTNPPNVVGTVATLQQVLVNDLVTNTSLLPLNHPLGRAAVASYLNAIEYAPNYPLSTAQVVAMFNAVIGGGIYDPTGVNWNAAQVKAYFDSLYPAYTYP
jgi:hypothetical protein